MPFELLKFWEWTQNMHPPYVLSTENKKTKMTEVEVTFCFKMFLGFSSEY